MTTTPPNLHQCLDELERGVYYAEDFELEALVRSFIQHLTAEQAAEMPAIVLARLEPEVSTMYALFCAHMEVPGAAPRLAAALTEGAPDWKLARAAIRGLARQGGDLAYRAIASYLDSPLAADVLPALAAIDFTRTLPYLVSAMREAALAAACMRVLHEHCKRVGLESLTRDLRNASGRLPRLAPRMKALCNCGLTYAPFTKGQLRCLELAAHGVDMA